LELALTRGTTIKVMMGETITSRSSVAVGAAGGTAVAIQTASRDVVVSAGSPVVITLTGPLTLASR
jgi:hypothetical protein